jgi:3-deoxy-D-manno-octulosonic acid kinase
MMTKDGWQRIATAAGAILTAPEGLGDAPDVPPQALFEPEFWAARGALTEVTGGRGAAWFIAAAPHQWVLRHYRRGGLVALLTADCYAWLGEERVRAFAEWRLLASLTRLGMPVPRPIAARYERAGLTYRCDLITQRIMHARPLSAVLSLAPLPDDTWREVGATVARLHAVGADHADLNAHNILLGGGGGAGDGSGGREVAGSGGDVGGAGGDGSAGGGTVSVIDFDRGRLRSPGAWAANNLRRLHRSLCKIARTLPADRFSAAAWSCLLAGYAARYAAG